MKYKRKHYVSFWMALKKIWRIGRCNHYNQTEGLVLGDTYQLVFCNKCGRILSLTGDTQREKHPHTYNNDRLEKPISKTDRLTRSEE